MTTVGLTRSAVAAFAITLAARVVATVAVATTASAYAAEPSGEAIFAARCASCHDAPPSADNRAPPKALLKQMSVARIVRTMDFGAMMSLTYMLNRAERQAVAAYLGVPGEDREPPAKAFCAARSVAFPRRRTRAISRAPVSPPCSSRNCASSGSSRSRAT